ncbi:hypothetical protein ACFLX5_03520 [Chloroflexota bacterium]
MTQAEIELIARQIRGKCIRSSWIDLVAFWQGVMSNLESAYNAVRHGLASYHQGAIGDLGDTQKVVGDKLAIVLSQLAGEEQMAKLNAKAMMETQVLSSREGKPMESKLEL